MCPIGVYSVCCVAGLNLANHDLAGIHAGPDLDRRASLAAQPVADSAGSPPASRKRRVQRALRMVLVRDRRAEQREDAVAGRLHDMAVIAAHRVDHQLQGRIDDRARFFGIEILLKPGRVDDVDEQRGDELALAFGTSVASFSSGSEAGSRSRAFRLLGRERAAALIAEFRSWPIELAAFGAGARAMARRRSCRTWPRPDCRNGTPNNRLIVRPAPSDARLAILCYRTCAAYSHSCFTYLIHELNTMRLSGNWRSLPASPASKRIRRRSHAS